MGEVCVNWKKANCAPILKKDNKDNPERQSISPISVVTRIMELDLLELISGHTKEKVIRNSWRGFTKGK